MPSDALSETEACDLLAKVFRGRGYDIQRNIPFSEYGASFHIDGWDPKARVGYEFLSSEDEDHDDLSLKEYQALMVAQMRGELALFVIDEVEPLSAKDLRETAEEFLDEVASARAARRKPARKKAKASSGRLKAGAKKSAVKSAKKKAVKKSATKKAGKKPQPKKKVAGSKSSAKKIGRSRA